MTYASLNIQPAQLPIFTLLSRVKNVLTGGLDISPDYQHNYIWSN